uniref:Uncharacterized protein n=1 Tax=Romanomermis culicivorax TaxID=13658 RepID=A0A915HSW7_ROMCU
MREGGNKGVDDLYVPVNARSKVEKAVVEQLFPPVDGAYVPSRTTNERGQIVVIATAQDGGSILQYVEFITTASSVIYFIASS